MKEVVERMLRETLERITGVAPIVGVMAYSFTPALAVWGTNCEIVDVPLERIPEVTLEDFYSMCDEDGILRF